MSSADVHVIPLAKGWEVRRTGGRIAVSNHHTRSSAIRAGRMLAAESCTNLFVHDLDGRTVSLVEPHQPERV